MTAFSARTRPGPPTNGRYQLGDTVPDSNNVIWSCVKGGFAVEPGSMVVDTAVFAPNTGAMSAQQLTTGAASIATVTAVEELIGNVHKTTLTLAAVPQTVVNGTEYQGTKIYDFPEGLIVVTGTAFSLAQTTTSVIASTLNSGVTGAVALGSVTASNVSLTSTMANFVATTAFSSSTTINVAGTAVTGKSTAALVLDGTATAVDLYLNSAYATTTDVDADATQTWSGTITLLWQIVADV